MRNRLRTPTTVALALIAACRAPVPEQVLSRPAPAAPAPPTAVARGPWVVRPAAERRPYVVEQRAVLTIRQDTATRIDTVTSRAELVFVAAPPANRLSGTVTSYRVQIAGREAATPAGLVLPLDFAAEPPARGRQLVFSTPAQTGPCSSPSLGVAQSLRDLWFQPPDTVRLGSTWEDSTTYAICRDGIPIRAAVRHTFRVTDALTREARTELLVRRSSRTMLDGQGRQAGEPVSVSGSGSGELTYSVDPRSGAILSAQGTATLELTLRSRFRTQAVKQSGEIRIASAP